MTDSSGYDNHLFLSNIVFVEAQLMNEYFQKNVQ